MIYHILPESEPLSAVKGGALAHTVANLMRLDDSRIAVCGEVDDTVGFSAKRVIVIPRLRHWSRVRGRRFIPPQIVAPAFRRMFRPLLKRIQAGDIVWCHSRPVFASAIARYVRAKGAKLICHFHEAVEISTARVAFLGFRPDVSVFVSEFLRQEWLRALPDLKNTYTVHNGADENQFFPRADTATSNPVPIILFVGRLHPDKGADVLVDAMRILDGRGAETICRMVGSAFSGNSRANPYIANLIASSPKNVEFTGFCSANKIGDEYRRADIFCCPSIWQEPFGKVNVEAMGCGLPVVATRVGGIPEIARDGGVVLVNPRSALELADALEGLIRDREYRCRVGASGLASFRKQFTWSSVLDRYREITDSL
jgi:spore coat protein SA